jgi:thiamine pyrophosphate-dependent acetolactate synthase large subunit-like protein
MKSYEALRKVSQVLTDEDLVVVTSTGRLKNEWYSVMPGDGTIFLPLMGGALPFALGMALALSHRRIVVLDTDGSMLFDTAPLCTIANELPPNLTSLVFDNEMYESIGGPPTHTSRNVDLEKVAQGAGIPHTGTAREPEDLLSLLTTMLSDRQPGLIVVKVERGAHPDFLAEPEKTSDFLEDKYRFIRHIERIENVSIRSSFVQD